MQEGVDRSLVRTLNSASVLRLVKARGPLSRAAIARGLGLSSVTVGAIVADLIDRELVVENGETAASGGRPGRLVSLRRSGYGAIGVKLTDRCISGAATDLVATVVARAEEPLIGTTPEDFVAALSRLVDRLLETTGWARHQLLGVGIGMAGVVATATGTAVYSPFLDWHDVPVRDMAARALDTRVVVDNDVNALALAERWFGTGQETEDFVLVTLGQGVGLGIVAGGRLVRGHRGGAGELGHVVSDASSHRCSCGGTGCLEAMASEPALLARATAAAADCGDPPPQNLTDLYERASSSAVYRRPLVAAGRAAGRAIANLVNTLAPELVIVTGSCIEAGPQLVDALEEAARAHVFPGLAGSWRLVVDPGAEGLWVRGAASLVLAEQFTSPTAGVHPEPEVVR